MKYNFTNTNCYRRSTCRLCDGTSLELRLALTACPPVDAFVTKDRIDVPQESFPLDLFMCNACGHFQLLDIVNPTLLFGDYIYTTSSSPGLVEHFEEYAESVSRMFPEQDERFALDIGSNDGTLLKFLSDRQFRVLGVDPATDIARRANERGLLTVNAFFSSQTAQEIVAGHGKADLITANNVFAHSDDLSDMAIGIKGLLQHDGVFVFEVSYMLDMIDNMVFDFIYHEHLSHHSVRPLKHFLERFDLELFNVQQNKSKGGSLRCFAQHKGGPRTVESSVATFIKNEDDRGLYQQNIFDELIKKIDVVKSELNKIIDLNSSAGKALFGYGASATGTVLMYHFGLGNHVTSIIDDNPLRQSRFSPGHHIPIVSSEILLENPNSTTIILAWRFAEMIVNKNRPYINSGGRFVVPLPEFRIVD